MTSIGKENRSGQCLPYTERTEGGGDTKKSLSQAVKGLGGVVWVYKVGLK